MPSAVAKELERLQRDFQWDLGVGRQEDSLSLVEKSF